MTNFNFSFMNSPLEQFSIYVFHPAIVPTWFFDFTLTNFAVSIMFFNILFFIIFFYFINSVQINFFFNNFFVDVLVYIYDFVKNIVFQQMGNYGRFFINWSFTIFIIILFFNFFGLSIIGFTITAQLFVVVFLSFSLNLGIFFTGFQIWSLSFIKIFVPSGLPFFLVPFMVCIEIFSYIIRPISLSIRLFANMMAGHALMHIISGFFVNFFWSYSYFGYIFSIFSFFLLISIFVLEIAVAFLQSYVYLTLFCIYLNDSIKGAHLNLFLNFCSLTVKHATHDG